MAAGSKFPLLRLPNKAILQTFRVMDLYQILKFSLISERCKDLVRSIKIKPVSFVVSVFEIIYVYIDTGSRRLEFDFFVEQDMYWEMGAHGRKKKLTAPKSVTIEATSALDHTTSTWENNTLTMKYWFKHLQDIFNYPKIDHISFSGDSSEFDIDGIKEIFGNTTKATIENTGCLAFNQMILQHFFPIEKLSIKTSDFQDSKVPEGILMQGFDELHIGGIFERTSMGLNELLLTNSKGIRIQGRQMPKKQLNSFIKLWQKGSNSQMEYIYVDYFEASEDDKETIMKGIKHEVIPDNQRRNFKSVGLTYPDMVSGGMDINRMDGTKATIWIQNQPPFTNVKIFVWFDHCIMAS